MTAALTLLVALASGAGADTSLRQCQMALQACMAEGPIPLTFIRPADADTEEYQDAERAAGHLKDATRDLSKCAARADFEDDCAREARQVRYAADEYEAASDAYRRRDR